MLQVKLNSRDARVWLHEHPEEEALIQHFVARMVQELADNNNKGNRPGWLSMTRKEAVAEVHWHASKLAVAAKAADTELEWGRIAEAVGNEDSVRELAADTANCALMLLDVMGLLSDERQEFDR